MSNLVARSLLLLLAGVAAPAAEPASTPTPVPASEPASTPTPAAVPAAGGARFGLRDVAQIAAQRAREPYVPDDQAAVPDALRELGYDGYRDIRFRPERSIWRGEDLPFEVQLFCRGFNFSSQVRVNLVDAREVKHFPFSPDLFDFSAITLPAPPPPDFDFAGLRLHYPINRPDYRDEVAVFLGASYFRAVGRGQIYGLSARAIALDTGLTRAEEFPAFREFWLRRPETNGRQAVLFALLEGPRVVGAYRFQITPGDATVVEVRAHLFFREAVEKLGLAPLGSMFFFGELKERRQDDFRPEVHDSDGLLLVTGSGERIWRPLGNPGRLRTSRFAVTDPRGFGLLQRDRSFDHYQDLEARYERRPSAWVTPVGRWGEGAIELIEIPTGAEFYDNIVVHWVPREPVKAGDHLAIEYRIAFTDDPEQAETGGRVVATRLGAGGSGELDPARRKFVVDFAGPSLAKLPPQTEVEGLVSTSAGTVDRIVVQPNPHIGGYRLSFELTGERDAGAEIRASLRQGANYLTETWTYQWRPER